MYHPESAHLLRSCQSKPTRPSPRSRFQLSAHCDSQPPRKCQQLGSSRKGQRVESHVSHFKGACLLPSVGLCRFFTMCMFLEMFCMKRHVLHICRVSVGQTETLWSHFLASSERCGFLSVIMIGGCLSQKNDAKQRPPFPFMVRRQRLAPNWGEEF